MIRAASNIAPAPTSVVKICDECAWRPVTSSRQRVVLLEHGIQVPDEHQLPPLVAVSAGDQMTGAVYAGHVGPVGVETECVELGPRDVTHLADTLVVHGAAVDVHESPVRNPSERYEAWY